MMAVMVLLSFIIAYPLFMFFIYLLARVIFTPLDKIAEEQQKERMMLLQKARRHRKRERQFAHA